jgi:hypothetical protein
MILKLASFLFPGIAYAKNHIEASGDSFVSGFEGEAKQVGQSQKQHFKLTAKS